MSDKYEHLLELSRNILYIHIYDPRHLQISLFYFSVRKRAWILYYVTTIWMKEYNNSDICSAFSTFNNWQQNSI